MRILLALVMLGVPLHAISFSLKGPWEATISGGRICEADTNFKVESFSMEITEAPFLNSTSNSFDLKTANVSGPFKLIVSSPQGERFTFDGTLLGSLIRLSPEGGGSQESYLALQAQILSPERVAQYRDANSGLSGAEYKAPFLHLRLTGNLWSGHALSGSITGGHCATESEKANALSEKLTPREDRKSGSRAAELLRESTGAGAAKADSEKPSSSLLSGTVKTPSPLERALEMSPYPDPTHSAVVHLELKQK